MRRQRGRLESRRQTFELIQSDLEVFTETLSGQCCVCVFVCVYERERVRRGGLMMSVCSNCLLILYRPPSSILSPFLVYLLSFIFIYPPSAFSDVVARRRLRAAKSQIVQATRAARSKRVRAERAAVLSVTRLTISICIFFVPHRLTYVRMQCSDYLSSISLSHSPMPLFLQTKFFPLLYTSIHSVPSDPPPSCF
jgi:hypothetical protein